MRELIRTEEFIDFYKSLPSNVQNKVKYVLYAVVESHEISTKFVKKLIGVEFYEMRISVGNEYRVILFAVDHKNIIEARKVILLNGFMKKSNKDYIKAVIKARKILNDLQL